MERDELEHAMQPIDITISNIFLQMVGELSQVDMGEFPLNDDGSDRIVDQLFREQPIIPKHTDPEFISTLEIHTYKKEASEVHECMICMEPFQEGDTYVALPCTEGQSPSHIFHYNESSNTHGCLGILPWLSTNNHCPICRHEFPSCERSVQEPEQEQEQQEPEPLPDISQLLERLYPPRRSLSSLQSRERPIILPLRDLPRLLARPYMTEDEQIQRAIEDSYMSTPHTDDV